MYRFGVFINGLWLFVFLPPLAAVAEDVELIEARVEVNWRSGHKRNILMTEFWAPLAQNEKSVLYGDLRLMGDDGNNREGNLGIGYRQVVRDGVLGDGVAGVNGWLDRRFTDLGSDFHQVTVGAEWLGETFDVRANAYLPLSDKKRHTVANPDAQAPAFAGTGIVADTDMTVLEEPQGGFDIEFGWEVPFLGNLAESARVYAGGYSFDGDNTDRVSGGRVRVAADITPDIQIGARFQRDGERGSQGFLEATFRFPFGRKRSYRQNGLRARLDESPERDIDIVTGQAVTDTGDRVPVLDAATGQEQQVLHVDNAAAPGGDGTVEAPFDTLAAAEAAAKERTIIYVHEGDGTAAGQDQGVTLDDPGQWLIGAGADFVYDADRFAIANGAEPRGSPVIAPAAAAPVLSNINANGDGVLVAADDVRVQGISVDGATQHGIHAFAAGGVARTGVQIREVSVSANGRDGVRIAANGAGSRWESAAVESVTATGNGVQGVYLLANSGGVIDSATVENATATGNADQGFWFRAIGTGSRIAAPVVWDIAAENNGIRGVWFRSSGNGAIIDSATVENVTATGNNVGIFVMADGGGAIDNMSLNNMTATSNSGTGVSLQPTTGGTINGTVLEDITVANNASQGLAFRAVSAGSRIAATAAQNITAMDNGSVGVWIRAESGGEIDGAVLESVTAMGNLFGIAVNPTIGGARIATVTMRDVTAADSISHGVLVQANSGGAINDAVLESVTATANGAEGVFLRAAGGGTLTADIGGGLLGSTGLNRIFGNTGFDLRVDLDGGELEAENNWWGDTVGLLPGRVRLDDGSTVDAVPFLTVDPQN